MKIFLLTSMLCAVLIVGPVHAGITSQTGSGELYELFNALFYAEDDPQAMNSNLDLMNSTYFLANGTDTTFGDAGDTLRIDLTYRESGWGGELGIWDGTNDPYDTGYQTLVEEGDINKNAFTRQDVIFSMSDGYTFADTDMENGKAQNRWSADSSLNLLATDQFLAFSIKDDALLSVYNDLFSTDYSAAEDDVWMIGFEEHTWNADYNDLVAIVSRPSELNTVPVPGAALLMVSGLAVVAGRRRWRRD